MQVPTTLRRRSTLGATTVLAIVAMLAMPMIARATMYTVNTLSDPGVQGTCSLRDAMRAANGHPNPESSCTAKGTDSNAINFSVGGRITLRDELPRIHSSLTISGPSAAPGITIDGDNRFRGIPFVNLFISVHLDHLTFSHCKHAIYNEGNLTITDSTFSYNSGSAGSAIDNWYDKNLTIVNCTFFGNRAQGWGAAIENHGTATIINSTFADNDLEERPHAFGGADIRGTAIDNGEDTPGHAYLKGTILANNAGHSCGGSNIIDEGYNISDDDSCGFESGTSHNNTDPVLSAAGLEDNGGPTKTVALQAASPAIDIIPLDLCVDADDIALTTDQRGQPRPDSVGEQFCDIGAYEFQTP